MEPFTQTLVKGPGIPQYLSPRFFRSAKDFAIALNGDLGRAQDSLPKLGIAILLTGEDTLLEAIAVATTANDIAILHTRSSPFFGVNDLATGLEFLSPLLLGQDATLVGFGMARIAMHIRYGLNTHVSGVEISEAVTPKERNLSPGTFVKNYVDTTTRTFDVDTLWDALPCDSEDGSARLQDLALRAWLTVRVAAAVETQYSLIQCIPVNTAYLKSEHFQPIQKMLIELEQMEAARSRVQQNDFKETTIGENGHVVIANDRFKSRVRPSDRKEVLMFDEFDRPHRGVAVRANGKVTHVTPQSNLGGRKFKAIFVVGKDEFNHAEHAREIFLLRLLQGLHDLDDPEYFLIQKLFFPTAQETLPQKISGAEMTGRLNQSQADVVAAIVHSEAPFVVVHGPPGTGKTSTISAALTHWIDIHDTVWVVSQSNVAVKNIAERLAKDNVPYRLLVSKEFYHEWHEHIYDEQVTKSLIRTDELPAHMHDIEVLFHGIHVVLCTLSTLSNPSLETKNVFDVVPVANLVVDEASQIGIFNYMHVFAQCKCLSRVCFFGDPKQLPPFGQDTASTLQSVFDVRHLKPGSYFLNMQYRMPVPIGTFISHAVYDGKLRSEHKISSHTCVAFVDVSLGVEEKDNKSFVNRREVQTVEHLVRHYYHGRDYCIVTPYDAQRNLLQKTLESAGLRSDNVYNVDSFQGNEADFIIISVVRTTTPGFIVSRNRVNVMLTRCKLGMVIVTNQAFIRQRRVSNTLLGAMLQYWERNYGRENTWRDWRAVAGKTADLPGANGSRRRTTQSYSSEEGLKSSLRLSHRALSSCKDEMYYSTAAPGVCVSTPSVPGWSTLRITHKESKLNSFTSQRGTRDVPLLTKAMHRIQINDFRHTDTPDFPDYLPTVESQPLTSGAWRNGPPNSLHIRPLTVSRAGLPSQKLTVLKKQVPSEILGSAKKSKRKKKVTL